MLIFPIDSVSNTAELPLKDSLGTVFRILELHLQQGEVAEAACSAFWALCLHGEHLFQSGCAAERTCKGPPPLMDLVAEHVRFAVEQTMYF